MPDEEKLKDVEIEEIATTEIPDLENPDDREYEEIEEGEGL